MGIVIGGTERERDRRSAGEVDIEQLTSRGRHGGTRPIRSRRAKRRSRPSALPRKSKLGVEISFIMGSCVIQPRRSATSNISRADEDRREHAGEDAEDQRDGEALHLIGGDEVERDAGDDGGDVGVDDGASWRG